MPTMCSWIIENKREVYNLLHKSNADDVCAELDETIDGFGESLLDELDVGDML